MSENTLIVAVERFMPVLARIRREDLTPEDRAALRALLGELEQLAEGPLGLWADA
jgi:hypothetical protein